MNVSVEKLPKSRVSLRIEVPPEDVKPYLERAARELSREHPPKGFRPGAVPFEILRSTLGDQPIVERALKELVPKTYVQTLLEREDIEAIGQPEVEVERVAFDECLVYRAAVAVLPGVQLGDYRSIRAAKRVVTVEDTEVARELEQVRKLRATYLTVPRGAAVGDRVEIEISAQAAGRPLETGASGKQPILLGEGHLVPGFEECLFGMREGAQKTFSLTFPENHHRGDLRGKAVEFHVTVGVVQQQVLPLLDDAFAKSLGKFSGLQDLKEQLGANLKEEKETREQERFRQEVLREVVVGTTYGEFPDVLVERELNAMLAELQEGVADTGLSFEAYLTQVRKSPQELKDQWRPQALVRLRAGLALRAIAKAERITATEEETQEEVEKTVQRFPDPKEARRRLDLDALTDMAAGAVRNRKVFTLLEELAAR